MNYLRNTEILPEKIFQALVIISQRCPTAVFGGSIALNAVGLLNRPVKDIDVFVPDFSSLTENGFMWAQDAKSSYLLSDTVTDVNGKLIQRTGIKVNGVNVCCFKVSSEEMQHSLYTLGEVTIKIQNVNYAIQAKKVYANKNDKHKIDLYDINQTFDELFN